MAKKSLKKRIDALVDALGGTEKPTPLEIRNELVPIGIEVEALEDGQALAEKEATIAALEAENENLKVELQTANTELEAFRVQRREQKEAERKQDIPDVQFQILKFLPSEHDKGNRPGIEEIARAAQMPVYEAGIHLKRLEKAERITWGENRFGMVEYHRTIEGDELVLARRLAGDSEAEKQNPRPKPLKYPYLSLEEALALKFMAGNGATAHSIMKGLQIFWEISLQKVELILLNLAEKKFAAIENEMTYGAPVNWILLKKGMEYLDERGEL